ncbi:MAG: cytochrome c, partial [bacterium]
QVGGMHERKEAGPPIAHEGSRVKEQWLVRFLENPSKHRPMGYVEGASSRMPNFRLSGDEARAIAAYFMTRVDKRTADREIPPATRREKARKGARLYAALRCRACHQGRATNGKPSKGSLHLQGPDLARAGRRLKEEHLILWLAGEVTRSGSQLEMDAHPLVPKLGLKREEIADLAAYLVTLR